MTFLNKNVSQTLLFSSARFFDRIAYYGTRSVIGIFMVNQTINFSNEKALNFYLGMTLLYYASGILGGYLGDKVWGNKKTLLIGCSFQVVSLFLFCAETPTLFYYGLTLFVLGGGLSYPNFFANFGKSNFSKKNTLDTSFTLLYLVSNLGTIIGTYFSIYLFGFNGFKLTFLCLAICYLLKLALLIDTKSSLVVKNEKAKTKRNITPLVILIFCSGIFWGTFELMGFQISYIEYELKSSLDIAPPSIKWSGIGTLITVFISLIALITWIYFKFKRVFKILIGLTVFVISILFLINLQYLGIDNMLLTYMLFLTIFGVAEVLVAPMILASITRISTFKNLAMNYGIFFTVVTCIIMQFYRLLPNFGLFSTTSQMLYVALIPILIIGSLLYIYYQKSESNHHKSSTDILDNFK